MKRKSLTSLIIALPAAILLTLTGGCAEYQGRAGYGRAGKPGEMKTIGGMEFVWIPGGEFLMGFSEGDYDERPVHRVGISGFWMGKYEVTQSQYLSITGLNPSHIKGDRLPVETVTRKDAISFCAKFSARYGVKARIPYEAEWEYACRAGTATEYYWGDSANDAYCWSGNNAGNKTHPVGGKKPNAWGLYDMSGNVAEWCRDWYCSDYYKSSPFKNPKGPRMIGFMGFYVVRGGAWDDRSSITERVRSSFRSKRKPAHADKDVGFRVVLPVRE